MHQTHRKRRNNKRPKNVPFLLNEIRNKTKQQQRVYIHTTMNYYSMLLLN